MREMKARGGGWEGKEGKRGFPWAFLLFCLPIVHCALALFRLLLFLLGKESCRHGNSSKFVPEENLRIPYLFD